MESTFEACENFVKFSINGFDGSKILSMRKLFFLTSLTEFKFENFNTPEVIDASYMFSSCSGISSFSLNGLDLPKVKDISHFLEFSFSILEFDDKGFETATQLENTASMFFALTSIQSIKIQNLKTGNVKQAMLKI